MQCLQGKVAIGIAFQGFLKFAVAVLKKRKKKKLPQPKTVDSSADSDVVAMVSTSESADESPCRFRSIQTCCTESR